MARPNSDVAAAAVQADEKVDFSEHEENKLVRKMDWLVLPITTLLYLLSFLDRSNIGNAKIAGLTEDIHITDYSTLLTVYFIGYVIAELPANWTLKATNPTFWLPTLTLVWSIVTICLGLVHNEAGLYACRFFLGVTEAGLFPGVVYLFSRFYKRKERTTRVSFFFSAAAAAGAFGGVLAYAIEKMDGVGGKPGWAWIFILEGLLTLVVSIGAYFVVPNYPHLSKRFDAREKSIIEARLRTDSDALDDEAFSWREVWRAATSLQVYGYCLLFHGFSFSLYTLSLFLPTIIKELGYESWQAQLLTVPPYVFAFLVTMSVAYASYKLNLRAPFIIGGGFIAIIGYVVLLTTQTVAGKYAAVFLCTGGVYPAVAILLAWPSENLMGQSFRATALALQIALGNLGAVTGTQVYRIPLGGYANKDYHVSFGLTIIFVFIGMSSAAALWYGLHRANQASLAKAAAESEGTSSKTSPASSVHQALTGNGAYRATFLYQL